jgi:hypothetical protein
MRFSASAFSNSVPLLSSGRSTDGSMTVAPVPRIQL